MAAYYCWILLFLLSFALNDVTDGCVPVSTPLTGICEARCKDSSKQVTLSSCNQTTLLPGSDLERIFYTSVIFEDSGIISVSSHAFSGHTLRELTFKDSFVKFEPEAFAGLTVTALKIVYNPSLTSLPSGVFSGVTGIVGLYLNDNNLQSLPADIFHGLTDLEWVFLSGNNLQSLPAGIFHPLTGTRLRTIYLNDNNLQSLPADIFTGLDLKFLYVQGNSISCFAHDLFQPLHSLAVLHMNQTVDIEGLCPQTFKGLGPIVEDYEVKLDTCIIDCSGGVHGLEIIDEYKTCNCSSYEGCLTCTDNTMTTMDVADMSSSAGTSIRRITKDTSGVWKQHGIIPVALLILSYSI